jgi:hypothetical protein
MSLRSGDLKDLVYNIFEIDSYKSKMGEDKDIVVVSFTVNEENAAKDLVNFIEKGYGFVLDADNTTGEQKDGFYKVFVELERSDSVAEDIYEMLDGVKKLTNKNDFRFRYYKNFKSRPATLEALKEEIPTDSHMYEIVINESYSKNYQNFFDKSFLNSIMLVDNTLFLKKAYADSVAFEIKDFGPTQNILESIEEKINMNDYAEILFLTKYIGDYNVTKFGKKTLTFENNGYTLVVERIQY